MTDERYSKKTDIASSLTSGLMSAEDKIKLNTLNNYDLPTASVSVKGGIIIGKGLTMTGDILNVTGSMSYADFPIAGISYSEFIGATSFAGGVSGLVPAPTIEDKDKFLCSNGTWELPPDTTYSEATAITSGLMSATDKLKLDSLENYTLPTASDSIKGGVKIGNGLSMDGETLNVTLSSGNSGGIVLGSVSSTVDGAFWLDVSGDIPVPKYFYGDNVYTLGGASSSIIVSLPTQSRTVTYDGTEKSPAWNNYDQTQLLIGGTTAATNAGTYTATFTPQGNCTWSSGTKTTQNVSWTIEKAAATLSLSANSGTVALGSTATFTVTTPSDGALSVTSSDTSVATATVSGNTGTGTGVANGSATITVSQAAGTNYTAPTAVTYSATVQFNIGATLNATDWATISAVSKAGTGDTYWDIGDCKEITLNGSIGDYLTLNRTLCVFILHFNYAMNGASENNIIWGGFKTALINGKDVALCDSKYDENYDDGTKCFNMNHWVCYNYGGWKGSDFRYDILGATSTQPSDYGQTHTTTNVGYDATAATLTNPPANTLLAALPSSFRNALRLWTRWVDAVGNFSNIEANIEATVDAVTLLTEFEVQGARRYANQYEQNHQTQMDYYKNGNSKVKYNHSRSSSSVSWRYSSTYFEGPRTFCYVDSSGNNASGAGVYHSFGVAPAFKT